MALVYLNMLAHGRSGDKGDTSNVCVYARDPKDYEFLKRVLTVERVKEYFGDMVKGEIIRYDVDSLCGMNFVMKQRWAAARPILCVWIHWASPWVPLSCG